MFTDKLILLNYSIFRYKNSHISPTEIEGILHEHPAVNDCFVFGKDCDGTQQLVSALVVKETSSKVI